MAAEIGALALINGFIRGLGEGLNTRKENQFKQEALDIKREHINLLSGIAKGKTERDTEYNTTLKLALGKSGQAITQEKNEAQSAINASTEIGKIEKDINDLQPQLDRINNKLNQNLTDQDRKKWEDNAAKLRENIHNKNTRKEALLPLLNLNKKGKVSPTNQRLQDYSTAILSAPSMGQGKAILNRAIQEGLSEKDLKILVQKLMTKPSDTPTGFLPLEGGSIPLIGGDDDEEQ